MSGVVGHQLAALSHQAKASFKAENGIRHGASVGGVIVRRGNLLTLRGNFYVNHFSRFGKLNRDHSQVHLSRGVTAPARLRWGQAGVRVGERRPTVGVNWRVREAVGIRPSRWIPGSAYTEIFERFEEQLRQLPADDTDEAAN